jgi:hypothetical protein
MDTLALSRKDPGDRVLGEPVDLQIRVQGAQLARDRNVALGVPEAEEMNRARGRPSGRNTVGSRGVRGRPKACSASSRTARLNVTGLRA